MSLCCCVLLIVSLLVVDENETFEYERACEERPDDMKSCRELLILFDVPSLIRGA